MKEDDFVIHKDTKLLMMENELLSLENRFLKSQIEKIHIAHSLPDARVKYGTTGSVEQELRRAKLDIVRLLKTLNRTPFAWLFRLKKAYREKEARYLNKQPDTLTRWITSLPPFRKTGNK